MEKASNQVEVLIKLQQRSWSYNWQQQSMFPDYKVNWYSTEKERLLPSSRTLRRKDREKKQAYILILTFHLLFWWQQDVFTHRRVRGAGSFLSGYKRGHRGEVNTRIVLLLRTWCIFLLWVHSWIINIVHLSLSQNACWTSERLAIFKTVWLGL